MKTSFSLLCCLLVAVCAVVAQVVDVKEGVPHRKTPPPVRCGDKVALRSELTQKFVNVAKDLSVAATTVTPGIGEIFVVSCKSKAVDAIVELGDSLVFKAERSGQYLNDQGSDTAPLTCNPAQAKGFFLFAAFDPVDDQARFPLLQETPFALRSMRPNLMTYVRTQSAAGVLKANSDNTDPNPVGDSFRLYRLPDNVDNYATLCPLAPNGKVCSGMGVCVERACDCNDNAVGEFCEMLREKAECSLIGDVHVESFDGGLYNIYELGEKLLYQEAQSTYKEAVAAFVSPWNDQPFTAVLSKVTIRRNGADGEEFLGFMRNGASVYYNCDTDKDLADAIKASGEEGVAMRNGLRVKWANQMWEVTSPSGLAVRVRPRLVLGLIDVFIGTNTPRAGTAEGACGNNNRDATDDLMPRMTERLRNEPNFELLKKMSVEDGRDYKFDGSVEQRAEGVANGKESEAFYQCQAKTKYVAPEETLLAVVSGIKGKEPSPDVGAATITDDLRNQVRTRVETALAAGFCDNNRVFQESTAACCRQVLVKARAVSELGRAPTSQADLDQTVTDAAIKTSWTTMFENPIIPQAILVKGDYIQCLEDVCKTKTSRFCLEEKQDTETQRNIQADDNELLAKQDAISAAQKRVLEQIVQK
jgi:hypothetical protein